MCGLCNKNSVNSLIKISNNYIAFPINQKQML